MNREARRQLPVMPPKPQIFKAPDGKEFTDRAAYKDYMMVTFYSFKNKIDEPSPLIKLPGSIDGQVFDIADCKNSTLVVADHSEQVQIDECHNCRIFIAACASSIFIRNCSSCTFFTACRQLRLRDVSNSTFYIYSMSEVHIEFSNTLRFAPFNAGYPEHAEHLKKANLNPANNLWYDIYDHNDPGKTHGNWALLPEEQYEAPWFPLGTACSIAVPRNAPHLVVTKKEEPGMQSFSMQDILADAEKIAVQVPALPKAVVTDEAGIQQTIQAFIRLTKGSSLNGIVSSDFHLVHPMGQAANAADLEAAAATSPMELVEMGETVLATGKDMAYTTFLVKDPATSSSEQVMVVLYTGVLGKEREAWRLLHAQKTLAFPL